MNVETLISLARSGRLLLLGRLLRVVEPVYRLNFLASAGRAGLLQALHAGPVEEAALLERLSPDPLGQDAARAWLELGVRIGELSSSGRGYALRGALARALARPENDDVLALLEEVVYLHTDLLRELPARLRRGERFTMADQEGEVIARSSRTLEPLILEVVRGVVPAEGGARLLEIGCGSGVYMRAALAQNPALTAVGLELQPAVAEAARKNLAAWGVAEGRATVEAGDVRDRRASPEFDLVTLHNNIYYFPMAERVALLTHVRGFLRPGGTLLLTTGCKGGSAFMTALDLWGRATEGCGPLPDPDQLVDQLAAAGFVRASAHKLMPGESFYAFTAMNP